MVYLNIGVLVYKEGHLLNVVLTQDSQTKLVRHVYGRPCKGYFYFDESTDSSTVLP